MDLLTEEELGRAFLTRRVAARCEPSSAGPARTDHNGMATDRLQPLGSVLVTGGSGFVGTRIINDFLADARWTSVSVVLRNPKKNIPNVDYHSADITEEKAVRALLYAVPPDESSVKAFVYTSSDNVIANKAV